MYIITGAPAAEEIGSRDSLEYQPMDSVLTVKTIGILQTLYDLYSKSTLSWKIQGDTSQFAYIPTLHAPNQSNEEHMNGK